MWKKLKLIALAGFLMCGVSFVSAELFVSEDFDYSGTDLTGQTGGTGWSAAWGVTSGTMTLSDDDTSLVFGKDSGTGDRVNGGTGAANRTMTSSLNLNNDSFYVSFLINKEASSGADDAGLNVFFYDSGNNLRVRYLYSDADKMSIGIFNNTEAIAAGTFAAGQTYLVVLKYDATAGTDTYSMSVFSAGDTVTEPASWDAEKAGGTSSTLTRFAWNTPYETTKNTQLDRIRIGDTFEDVAGSGLLGLLVEESWDYAMGSDSSTWTNGIGLSEAAWNPVASSDSSAVITDGLTLGAMPVSGNACYVSLPAGTGFYSATLRRNMDTVTVSSGDLWVSYLVAFDAAGSTTPEDEKLEIRTSLDMRTGIHENYPQAYITSGSDTSYTASYAPIKSGATVLYVAKFTDMGALAGEDAKCWILTADGYDSMAVNGGISEVNLDTYASVSATNSFDAGLVMSGTTAIDVVPVGRDGSTPSFTFDELRYGAYVEDVIPAAVELLLVPATVQIEFSGGLLTVGSTNLTLTASNTLQTATNLVDASWSNILPSVTGVTATNWLISTEDAASFYRIKSEQ